MIYFLLWLFFNRLEGYVPQIELKDLKAEPEMGSSTLSIFYCQQIAFLNVVCHGYTDL